LQKHKQYTRYKEFAKDFETDPVFVAFESAVEKEKLFEDHLLSLKKAKQDARDKETQSRIESFKEMLRKLLAKDSHVDSWSRALRSFGREIDAREWDDLREREKRDALQQLFDESAKYDSLLFPSASLTQTNCDLSVEPAR
jgi:hypothetical protein